MKLLNWLLGFFGWEISVSQPRGDQERELLISALEKELESVQRQEAAVAPVARQLGDAIGRLAAENARRAREQGKPAPAPVAQKPAQDAPVAAQKGGRSTGQEAQELAKWATAHLASGRKPEDVIAAYRAAGRRFPPSVRKAVDASFAARRAAAAKRRQEAAVARAHKEARAQKAVGKTARARERGELARRAANRAARAAENRAAAKAHDKGGKKQAKA